MAYHFANNIAYTFDFENKSWTQSELQLTEPLGSRYFTLPSPSCVFLIGGILESTLSRVLAFSEQSNLQKLKPMLSSRADLSALFKDETIYVLGGYNEENSQALNSVESYSISEGKWRSLPSMHSTRMKAAACFNNQTLYVLGGCSNTSIEKFDLYSEIWSILDMSMPLPLFNTGLTWLRGSIFLVLGGENECSEPVSNAFTIDVCKDTVTLQADLAGPFSSNKPPATYQDITYIFNDLSFTTYKPRTVLKRQSVLDLNSMPSRIELNNEQNEESKEALDQGVFKLPHHSAAKYSISLPARPRVLLIKRIGNDPEIANAYTKVARHLLELNAVVLVEPRVLSEAPASAKPFEGPCCGEVNLVVTLGGDGTVIWAIGLFNNHPIPPILAFSMGSLGFLTPYSITEYKSVFSNVFAAKRVAVELMSRVKVRRSGGEWTHATNEICIVRSPSTSMLHLDVYLDGEFCTTAIGDGLLVATPCGSTAYSLSAGGSIVHPNVPSILLTPICPHSLSFRPILVPDSVSVKITVSQESRNPGWVGIDGSNRFKINKGEAVEIAMSNYPVPHVMIENGISSWLARLNGILRWNDRKVQKPLI